MQIINNNYENVVMENISFINNKNYRLALHSWIPSHVKAVIFYIHGIQSHAGWLFEKGHLLAKCGIKVCLLDRRGCGFSEGMRGDIPDKESILRDHYSALQYVKNSNPKVPLTLFGQSMGGSILAALVSWSHFKIDFDKIIFCASALGKRHYQIDSKEREEILSYRTTELVDINLSDTDYTDEPQYLDFMKNDLLCYRKITKRSIATLIELEELYLNKPGILKNKSAAYIYPEYDPIVDLPRAISIFQRLTEQTGVLKSFPVDKHYLWFTSQHIPAVNWVRDFILG